MSAQFTKGPWLPSNAVDGAIESASNPGENLLGLDVEGYAVFMNRADTRMASAAPDLYEALVMVRDADEDCKADGLRTIPNIARGKIDAALAKAEGRS